MNLVARRIIYLPPLIMVGAAGMLADMCGCERAANWLDQLFEELGRRMEGAR